jgi:hypothetical protein
VVGVMKRVIAMMNDKQICHNFARGHGVSEGVNFVTTPLFF